MSAYKAGTQHGRNLGFSSAAAAAYAAAAALVCRFLGKHIMSAGEQTADLVTLF